MLKELERIKRNLKATATFLNGVIAEQSDLEVDIEAVLIREDIDDLVDILDELKEANEQILKATAKLEVLIEGLD